MPLETGACYLVKEREPDLCYRLFNTLLEQRVPGLCITRQYPDRVREQVPSDVRIVWLSHTPGEDFHNPTAIGTLAKVIQKFIEDNGGEGVVLLDGLEYLIINNGFLQTLMFVEHVNEFVLQRKAILLLPVSPDTLEEKELALLERNVKVFEASSSRIAVRLIPLRLDLAQACREVQLQLPPNSDIADSPESLDQKIRKAQRARIPFIVLISGMEARSGVLRVILFTGQEVGMSVESLGRAAKGWTSGGQ